MYDTIGYAIVTVKSIAPESRTFTGLATTPTPDDVGDIVEPLGVAFKNPLPLLLHHDATLPVGHAIFHAATKDGIAFTATIPTIDESGRLKERVDEAWQSVKAGLIRGVSIRIRAQRDGVKRLASGGIHWLKSTVHELSLVTIPANAEASILSIKSHDRGRPAAFRVPDLGELPAGVSAVSPPTGGRSPSMNVSDRITDLKTSRKQTADRMDAIYAPVLAESGELTAELRAEFDACKASLVEHDKQLDDLQALERAQVAPRAVPIAVAAPARAEEPERREGFQYVAIKAKRPPEFELVRYAMAQARAYLTHQPVYEVARRMFPDETRIHQAFKAAVTVGTTTDTTWAAPLATVPQTIADAFLEFLRPQTIIGQFGTNGIPSLTRTPFNSRIQSQTSGGSANWVGQGKLKPVTSFAFDAVTLGFTKIAGIAVLSDELVRFSTPAAEERVRQALADTVRERMDIDFIDPGKAAVTNVSPASITNGITATAHSGTDADAVRAAVTALLANFTNSNIAARGLVWIMPESIALQLGMMRTTVGVEEFPGLTAAGGALMGYNVITSQYAKLAGSPARNIVILVSAKDIFLADDGVTALDTTNQASVEMSDNPEGESGTVISMWQANLVGIRAERYVNWARGRDEAVAWLDNVNWAV